MDPGLRTSERGTRRPPSLTTAMGPTITCRNCRVQIPLDDIESHECSAKDLSAAQAQRSPHPTATTPSSTPTHAAAASMGLFPESPRAPVAATYTSAVVKMPPPPPALGEAYYRQPPAVQVTPTASSRHLERPPSLSQPYETAAQFFTPTASMAMPASMPSTTMVAPIPIDPQRTPSAPPTPRSVQAAPMAPPAPLPISTPPVAASSTMAALSSYGKAPTPTASDAAAPVQCRVRGVRLNKSKVAIYSLVTNLLTKPEPTSLLNMGSTPPPKPPQEIIVERRYREFYAFALHVFAMFPSQDLWQRLPPKTLCAGSRNLSTGFLLRRKNGLDTYIRAVLQKLALDPTSQGTIGQWYLVRKFLNLPPTLSRLPTKDRDLGAAMDELVKHTRQNTGWTQVGRADETDAMFEKITDGFHMMKRLRTCPYPVRAIFDMLIKRDGASANADPSQSSTAATTNPAAPPSINWWEPIVEKIEVVHRQDHHTWTERTIFKGNWARNNMEMISIKQWKSDETGRIIIVMIPANEEEFKPPGNSDTPQPTRVDCVLGGWVLTPIPGEETCSVTWLMQVNFGECDPQREFLGALGMSSFVSRRILLSWADEITHLLAGLEQSYDPAYYRKLGTVGEFNKVRLDRADPTSTTTHDDPRAYTLATELEPAMCLMVQKNTNSNVLIFKVNHRSKEDLDQHTPLKAEWIMLEKEGNPRESLSAIERTTTYSFSTKHIGPNVFQFSFELLHRDCVLRYDPAHGFGLFTTLNGKPNVLLKRAFIKYGKPGRLSFSGRIEETVLVGETETEVIGTTTSK